MYSTIILLCRNCKQKLHLLRVENKTKKKHIQCIQTFFIQLNGREIYFSIIKNVVKKFLICAPQKKAKSAKEKVKSFIEIMSVNMKNKNRKRKEKTRGIKRLVYALQEN